MFENILCWLSKNILDLLVALGTIVSAFFAARSLGEIEKTRKDDYMPVLKISSNGRVTGTNHTLQCRVENSGRGPAKNLRKRIGDQIDQISIGSIAAGESLSEISIKFQKVTKESLIEFLYEDIYGREFKTTIEFVPDADGLVVSKDKWIYHGLIK